MQSGQWNFVQNESSREQDNNSVFPVASAAASETAPEKTHSDQQHTVTQDTFAAFTWLFGSGCY